MTLKFPLIDNLRRYGGNFAAKLADAMAAADPENFNILVQAFPGLVGKYANMDLDATDTCSGSPQGAICCEIDSIRLQLQPMNSLVATLESWIADIVSIRQPLEEKLDGLMSKLYIIQNSVSREKIHFSEPKVNGGIRFNDIGCFSLHLKAIPLAERKPFVEWNGSVYVLTFFDSNPKNPTPCFLPTPARISELED